MKLIVALAAYLLPTAAWAPQVSGQVRPLADQLGAVRDVRNGFIDYLNAADYLQSARVSMLLEAAMTPGWSKKVLEYKPAPEAPLGSEYAGKVERMAPTPEMTEYAHKIGNLTPLDLKREVKRELAGALRHLDSGRKKEFWEPRSKLDIETTFPELAGFKNLAKFLTVVVVDVEFADGNGAAATQAILDGLRVGEVAESSGTLIGALVSRACQAMSLRAVERNLPRFSIKDCQAMESYSDKALRAPSRLAVAMEADLKISRGLIDNFFTDDKTLDLLSNEDFAAKVRAIPTTQRPGFLAQVRSVFDKRAEEIRGVFEGSERDWAIHLDSKLDSEDDNVNQPLANQVADMLTPVHEQVLMSALLQRVQLRLLRAAIGVMRYRWMNGRLPIRLTDAVTAEVAKNPVSGQQLQYRVHDQFFELIGTGARSQGEIKLVYRKANSEAGGPPPP